MYKLFQKESHLSWSADDEQAFEKLIDALCTAPVLVFPNLDSANITYKVIKEIDGALSIGPIIMGMDRPVHILQLKASVDEIINMSAIAVVDVQSRNL